MLLYFISAFLIHDKVGMWQWFDICFTFIPLLHLHFYLELSLENPQHITMKAQFHLFLDPILDGQI